MNEKAQLEEIETLKAIYFADELLVQEKDIQVWASVEIPQGLEVKFISSLDNPQVQTLLVKHLPPVKLEITLPSNYPSTAPPEFTLSCEWIDLEGLSLLSCQLVKIWEHNLESPIIYEWIEFLKTEALTLLGIKNELDLTKHTEGYLNRLARRRAKREKSEANNCDSNGLCAGPAEKTEGDKCSKQAVVASRQDSKREILKPSSRSIIQILEAYDREQETAVFLKEFHTCKICFTDKAGKDCTFFQKCGHIFCQNCLSSYFTVLIKDGNVAAIKCPAYECSTETTQAQVRELVTKELFEKYDRSLLNTMLDTMSDLVYCPRAFCQYPVFWEPEERVAVCPNCQYAFCIYCKMGYHGIEPCRINADERRKLVNDYQSATGQDKRLMESRYGKKNLETLVSNTLSEYWIKENSKNCPNCNLVIEKSEGCNKMTCVRCKAFFCWLCGAALDRLQPYIHFRDPKSACNNKLFEFVDSEEEWESEGEEDVFEIF